MSSTGFNLSPVIDLLDTLSAGPKNPFVLDPKAVASGASGDVRSLGDFSALWSFLNDCHNDSTPLPSLDSILTPPPSPPPPPVDSPEKGTSRRRKRRRSPNVTVTLNGTPIAPEQSPATDSTENHTDTTEEIPRKPPRTRIRVTSTFANSANPAEKTSRSTPRIRLTPASILPRDDGLAPVVQSNPLQRPVIRTSGLPVSERKAQLIQMIMRLFPSDRVTLLTLDIPRPLAPQPTDIHVFIDNSNILISFYELIKQIRGQPKTARVRAPKFSFHNFSLILERGRPTVKKALVGSSPITPVMLEAEALGYENSILERVVKERAVKYSSSSGSDTNSPLKTRMAKVEQAVDEILHLKMMESIVDYEPSTLVLASGDAAAGEYSPGFFKVVERALKKGWNVELVAFKKSLGFSYKAAEFKTKWKGKFRYIQLDQFAEMLLDE